MSRKLLWLPILLWVTAGYAQDTSSASSSTSSSSLTPSASPTSSNPTATLDQATASGISTAGVHKFLGIPFASPPINSLRFSAPVPVSSYNATIDASHYGYSCPQQNVSLISNYFHFRKRRSDFGQVKIDPTWMDVSLDDDDAPPENEDCLTVNVMRPDNASESSNLPVVVWIVGGGFETGTTYASDADAVQLVTRSNELGHPLVYVSMNYRVSGWGFLASQEVQSANATNLGLRDQRLAMQWTNRYIKSFGGDNTRVVIWGQSAGAISASLHMLTNNGSTDGLFRGAFMQSGAPIPIGNYTEGQSVYDQITNQTNCASSNDTLNCLRSVPFEDLKTVINRTPNYYSYSSLDLTWVPRADGIFLVDTPQRLVLQNSVARIPMVTGNVDDEGTVFALSSLNVTDSDEFKAFLDYAYLQHVPDPYVNEILNLYPNDSSAGSPFNTSNINAITPEYKRSAAFQGDVVFQAPRRFFVQQRSGYQPVWSYLSTRKKQTPFVGSYHGSDLANHILDDYLIYFVANLNPNTGNGPEWPQYDNNSKQIYSFINDGVGVTTDDYRVPQISYLTNVSLEYPS
ncbi:alpha/beta-hydrolase [Macrolepiota fuliginosa MF-IS2]|uniref:Carboxylic ester hydrolase n=1 Tax=Macrolepiota fuliginosa MF-IS2 TaxID=1400762 RepID=A0A9P6C3B3_9AGAR|nr:alpha/beta-hydrolase [Macrolepiota fuliginosa MF-IS2]